MLKGLTKTCEGIAKEIKAWKKSRAIQSETTVGNVHAMRTRIRVVEAAGLRPVDDILDQMLRDINMDKTKMSSLTYFNMQDRMEEAYRLGTYHMEWEMRKQIDS